LINPSICVNGSDFVTAFEACKDCVRDNKISMPNDIPPLLPEFIPYLELCGIPYNITAVAATTQSAAYCAAYKAIHNETASNCSTPGKCKKQLSSNT
jgi:hypothetical protein